MPNNIYHKRNANTGVVPTAAQLTVGEIALNTADGKAYTRTTAGTVVELTEASVADGGEQFTPLNVPNLAMWLDASDSSTLFQDAAATIPATATNDPVGAWRDKSGNNRHATQTTAANRPTYSATAANGRPRLSFDTNDSLLSAATIADYVLTPTTNPTFTLIMACYHPPAGDAGGIAFGSDSFANGRVLFSSDYGLISGNTIFDVVNASGGRLIRQATRPSASPHIMTWYRHGASMAWRVDGVTLMSKSDASGNFTATTAQLRLGGHPEATFQQMFMSEAIAYAAALTPAQIAAAERALAAKWGITLAPQVSNIDAQDWINRVYQNAGTVSQSTAAAVNNFCNAINAAGIRDRFYRLNLFCGDNLAACLVPLYRGQSLGGTQFGNTTDTNNNFAASDYNERGVAGGLRGNTSNKWLNTGFDANAAGLPINNAHMAAVWPTYLHPVNSNYMLVSAVNSAVNHRFWLNTNSNTIPSTEVGAYLGQGSTPFLALAQIAAANGSIIQGGLWVASRVSGTDLRLYNNATERASAAGSVSEPAWPTNPVSVFARWDGTSTFGHSGINLWGYSVGLGLSAAQVTSFNTAMQAFQTTLARNV